MHRLLKIRSKILLGFTIISLLIIVIGLISFNVSRNTLQTEIGQKSVLLAHQTLHTIDQHIFNRFETVQAYSHDLILQSSLKSLNNQFDNMNNTQDFILHRDKEWINSSDNQPLFIQDLLTNELSLELNELVEYYTDLYDNPSYGEIFVTNKYGAVVGLSGLTSDYYQADEEWWVKARDEGLYVTNVEYDVSSDIYSINIAYRINDDSGKFLGVIKAVVNIEEIISIIDNVHQSRFEEHETKTNNVSKSWEMELINNEGKIIYSTEPHHELFESIPNFIYNQLSRNNEEQSINHSEGFFLANLPGETDDFFIYDSQKGYKDFKGLGWYLLIEYESDLLFAPITELFSIIISATLLIFVISFFIGVVFSNSLSKPITQLTQASKEISQGNLDTTININSKDEIGDLANSFCHMKQEIKNHNEMIEGLLEQKNEFIHILSHDLKNPLTAPMTLLPLIEKKVDDSHLKEMVRTVMHSVDKIKMIIYDTLKLARLDTLDKILNTEETNLNDLVIKSVNDSQNLIDKYQFTVDNNVSNNMIVDIDRFLIDQVFDNLISNAIKYTPEDHEQRIIIDTEDKDDSVIVSVKDFGRGIEQGKEESVFGKFSKDLKPREGFDSTGLGLSICKSIIERHDGQIWVESEGVGKGSTFYFSLPKHHNVMVNELSKK